MLLRQAHVLKVFVLFFVICIVLGLSILFSSSVTQASSNPIQVNSQSSTLAFPKSIDFKISVHDSRGSLAQATIYLTYQNLGYRPSHQVAATGGTSTYTFQWHDNLLANIYEFPTVGTQISYYWTITDTAGNSYTSPSQTIENSRQPLQLAAPLKRLVPSQLVWPWYGLRSDGAWKSWH